MMYYSSSETQYLIAYFKVYYLLFKYSIKSKVKLLKKLVFNGVYKV